MSIETENRKLGMDEVPSTEELTKALNPLYIESFKSLPKFKLDISEPTDEQLLFSKDSTSWNNLPNENAIVEYTIMPTTSDTSILQFEHMLYTANVDRPAGFLGGCIRSLRFCLRQGEPTLYPVLFFTSTWSDFPESHRGEDGWYNWINKSGWEIVVAMTLSTPTNGKLASKFLEDIHNYQRDVSEEDKHLTLFLSDTFLGRSIADALRHDQIYAPLLEAHTHIDNDNWNPNFAGHNFIYIK